MWGVVEQKSHHIILAMIIFVFFLKIVISLNVDSYQKLIIDVLEINDIATAVSIATYPL